MRVARPTLAVTLALGPVGLAAAMGCGRRATHADCQLIVDKSVELQMKEMSLQGAPAIEKRAAQVRSDLQEEIKSCEGRHVTVRTISCIQAATATKELDACLR